MHQHWPTVKQYETRLRELSNEGDIQIRTMRSVRAAVARPSWTSRLTQRIANRRGRFGSVAAPRLSLEEVAVRRATPEDRIGLSRLAALAERRLGDGSYLVAEVDGELTAAVNLDDGAEPPITDPFRPSAAIGAHLKRLISSSDLRWTAAKPAVGG